MSFVHRLRNNRSLVLDHEKTNTAPPQGASGTESDIYMERSDKIIRDPQAVHINKNHSREESNKALGDSH